jgi:threonine synthase
MCKNTDLPREYREGCSLSLQKIRNHPKIEYYFFLPLAYIQTKRMKIPTAFVYLECSECGKIYDKSILQTFCTVCIRPLLARYEVIKLNKSILLKRPKTLWRYLEMLPVEDTNNIVSLGEGMTPLLDINKLGKRIGLKNLYLKDESGNPTASFKARGLCLAISKAKEYGVQSVAIPTAGNAGSAMSAYAAKASMAAHVYMPQATPSVFQADCQFFGATITRVEGSIRDCGVRMKADNIDNQWFDVSTLKEPYRIEGKKTMGYEIAEQFNWQLPDVILYPAGGGTGLIGIWKAFQELLAMGWITHIPTRMVCVQATGCAPIVDAFDQGLDKGLPVSNPEETIANGLRVPAPFGDKIMLRVLKESHGTALTITDAEMLEGIKEVANTEGVFVAPEGAAVWMALKKLMAQGWVSAHEKVVLLNTGSAYKYLENM